MLYGPMSDFRAHAVRFAAVAALAAPLLRAQQVVTFEPVRDTAIFSNGALTSGGGNLVTGATVRFGNRRALIAFDLQSLPPGATVLSASFEMTMSQTNSGPAATSLHRLLAPWGEGLAISPGGSGAPAAPGDATWTEAFFGSVPWQSPGADFASAATATVSVDQPARYTWPSSPAMVADVQSWVNAPATNHGWIAITDETNTSAKLWHSREFALPSSRPILTVQFTVPAAASSFGAGCVAPNATPVLGAIGVPSVGNSAFALDVQGGQPSGVVLVFFGSQALTPAGSFGNCPVHIAGNLELAAWGIASATGTSRLGLAVPNQPALVGLGIFTQALTLDASTEATSNGLELRVGT